MRKIYVSVLLLVSSLAHAGSNAFMTEGAPTRPPYGWVDFCARQPQECNQDYSTPPMKIPFNVSNFLELDRVNQEVNAEIEPVTNMDHWGTMLDHWDYPTPKDMRGDCKIYALWKRKKLMDMGFSRSALLMVIVFDLEGNGHTILDVHTTKGDYILDNMVDTIKPWNKTGYKYLKRQSTSDPNVWLSVGPAPTKAKRLTPAPPNS